MREKIEELISIYQYNIDCNKNKLKLIDRMLMWVGKPTKPHLVDMYKVFVYDLQSILDLEENEQTNT
jgi:hypothetical protein